MNRKYACIKDGKVDNIIVIEDNDNTQGIIQDIKDALGYSDILDTEGFFIDIGYTYENGIYTPPIEAIIEDAMNSTARMATSPIEEPKKIDSNISDSVKKKINDLNFKKTALHSKLNYLIVAKPVFHNFRKNIVRKKLVKMDQEILNQYKGAING